MSSESVRAGRRTVPVHRPEKVLFPVPGLTKAGLVDYYRSVASFMLPELRGRPLMLERHPDGGVRVESIRARLFTLPDDTVVHTGHGADTTIGAEKAQLK